MYLVRPVDEIQGTYRPDLPDNQGVTVEIDPLFFGDAIKGDIALRGASLENQYLEIARFQGSAQPGTAQTN